MNLAPHQPLGENNQSSFSKIDDSTVISAAEHNEKRPSLFNSKVVYGIYWLIILILVWNIVMLDRETDRLSNQLEEIQKSQNDALIQTREMLQKGENARKDMAAWQQKTDKSLQNIQIKSNYIKEMGIEQHYLKKVDNIRQYSKDHNFFKEDNKAKHSFLLAMNNFKLVHLNIHLKKEIYDYLRDDYERLSKEHDFTLPQLPFCVVVPTRNNGQNFRYEYNIYSIFNQNYTNFKVVIIDDASIDQNFQLISQFVEEHKIPQQVILHKNSQRMGTVYNIHKAANEFCNKDDIMALVDGDDELLGVNILKVYNSVYTKKKLDVLYSNIIVSQGGTNFKKGQSSAYSEQEKKLNKYREKETRMLPLRSFKVSTFLKIDVAGLRDDNGEWFRSASDQVIMPQLLELSCGRNEYIDEYFYLYNSGLGSNDIEVDAELNSAILNKVQHRKKYECQKK